MQQLGKYRIERRLGRGAMGVVYEGFDPDIERRVAIKTLHAHLVDGVDSSEFFERFRREARAAARCQHPNIVAVLEYGKHQDMPYLVMEFADGEPLDRLIKRGQPIRYKQLFSILGQLLSALHRAHGQGIVHRDLKPANIIITPEGKAKLSDFGIARLDNEQDLTRTGVAVGTPRFMPPEQLYGNALDARADLFALTMVMLDMLKNVPAHERVAMVEMPMVAGLPGSNRIDFERRVPLSLAAVIKKGLAAEPNERYDDAKAMHAALQHAMRTLSDGIAPAEDHPSDSTASPSPRHNEANRGNDEHTRIEQAQQAYETQISHSAIDDSSLGSLGSGLGTRFSEDSAGTRSGVLFTGLASSIDEATLTALKADFAKQLGSHAHRILQDEIADAISFAELVHALANKIDNTKKRQRFIQRWSS